MTGLVVVFVLWSWPQFEDETFTLLVLCGATRTAWFIDPTQPADEEPSDGLAQGLRASAALRSYGLMQRVRADIIEGFPTLVQRQFLETEPIASLVIDDNVFLEDVYCSGDFFWFPFRLLSITQT